MKKEFVRFFFPGTFFAEDAMEPISNWDVEQAKGMALKFQRSPFGFRFITRAREVDELDSKQVAESPMYYLGGKVETIDEVMRRDLPEEETLRWNMRANNHARVIHTMGRTYPLANDSVLLELIQ